TGNDGHAARKIDGVGHGMGLRCRGRAALAARAARIVSRSGGSSMTMSVLRGRSAARAPWPPGGSLAAALAQGAAPLRPRRRARGGDRSPTPCGAAPAGACAPPGRLDYSVGTALSYVPERAPGSMSQPWRQEDHTHASRETIDEAP